MGNCYKKQRTPVRTIHQNRQLSVETDDGLPYVLVFNNTEGSRTTERNRQTVNSGIGYLKS